MAKKKKTISRGQVLAHLERVEKKLVLELEEIKEEVKKMGVLGFGAAKKKGRK
jgi:hypothetical protein